MNPALRKRRSIRLQDRDYSSQGCYFLTICVKDRVPLLGAVIHGEMHLNDFGRCVEQEWQNAANAYPGVVVDSFVVMPDHLHATLFLRDPVCDIDERAIRESPLQANERRNMTIPRLVGRFKTVSAKWINAARGTSGQPVWQRNYHDHIVRNDREHQRIRDYIAANPSRWEIPDRLATPL